MKKSAHYELIDYLWAGAFLVLACFFFFARLYGQDIQPPPKIRTVQLSDRAQAEIRARVIPTLQVMFLEFREEGCERTRWFVSIPPQLEDIQITMECAELKEIAGKEARK
mgnify:FL=1